MKKYMIVADCTFNNGVTVTCMVYANGTQADVDRIINAPTKEDIYCLGKGKNVRLEPVDEENWWDIYGTE